MWRIGIIITSGGAGKPVVATRRVNSRCGEDGKPILTEPGDYELSDAIICSAMA
jgi:hypothetical protein